MVRKKGRCTMWLWLQKLMSYFQGEAEQRVEDEVRSPVNPAPRQLKAKTKSIYPKERASDREMEDFRSSKERQFRFPVVPDEYPLQRRKDREKNVDGKMMPRQQAPLQQEKSVDTREKARSTREVRENHESILVPKVEQKIEKQPPVRAENREQAWRKPERQSEKAVRSPQQADDKRSYQPSEIISPVYGKITPATREAEHRIHTTSGIVYPRLEQEEQLNQLKQWEKEISERYFPEEGAEEDFTHTEKEIKVHREDAWDEVQLASQEAALSGTVELARSTVAEGRLEEESEASARAGSVEYVEVAAGANTEAVLEIEEAEAEVPVESAVEVDEAEAVEHAESALEAEEAEAVAHTEPVLEVEEAEEVEHTESALEVEEAEAVEQAESAVELEEAEAAEQAESAVELEEAEAAEQAESAVELEEAEAVEQAESAVELEEAETLEQTKYALEAEKAEAVAVAHTEPVLEVEEIEAVEQTESALEVEEAEAVPHIESAVEAEETRAAAQHESSVKVEETETVIAPPYASAVSRLLERAELDRQDEKNTSPVLEAKPTTDQAAGQATEQAAETPPAIIEPPYVKPQLELLNPSPPVSDDDDEHTQIQKLLLEETLSNFNVSAHVVGIVKGPSVTRFELQPAPGVKVNKITSLVDDIKLNLAAKDIRIEAPIPGRNAIGIEVPNLASQPVMIEKIIGSEKFQEHSSPLAVALGMDIGGEPIIADIKKMPHGLIAGSTGSGKSVCINSIIVSLLYKATPEQVRLLLIDPKMVELAPYNHLPHLVTPVVTEAKQATAALKWCVEEMEKRYALFVDAGVRDIDRYNQTTDDALPFIVIVIDELADLMMVSPQDVEDCIIRIAQKARACGIHLLLATQRPSVDVITGNIKANVPTRLAFAVFSQVDSRTILDQSGAERLLGRGDMLFLESGTTPVRLQGNFVSDDEIERITQMIKKQRKPKYFFSKEDLEQQVQSFDAGDDPLYLEALVFVAEQGHASASGLQRRFRVGYNRAARLIEMMESDGYVAGQSGGKARAVLISLEDAQAVVEGSTLL